MPQKKLFNKIPYELAGDFPISVKDIEDAVENYCIYKQQPIDMTDINVCDEIDSVVIDFGINEKLEIAEDSYILYIKMYSGHISPEKNYRGIGKEIKKPIFVLCERAEKENIVTKACDTLNVTQTELGKMFDVPHSTVARWKKGEIPKMAALAIQYMLENIELRNKLNILYDAHDVLHRR